MEKFCPCFYIYAKKNHFSSTIQTGFPFNPIQKCFLVVRATVQAMVPAAVSPYFLCFYSPSISSLSVYVMSFIVGVGDLVALKNYKKRRNSGGVNRLLCIAFFFFLNFCFFKN
ncbi:hypothetical protein AAZX31_10G076000 [Glycine max]|nr:hypothetical protein JHK85_027921 [Glycine max]KAG5151058.1 hypothetical protein JHK84_027530 [Glycine max]